jgi:HEAT repeat protein
VNAPAPETPKPNRRRAVIVTTVFALVLGSIIYYLWTNNAYLKWRFVGGEEDFIQSTLDEGDITLDQIIALVGLGATPEVRRVALGVLEDSKTLNAPYDDRIVETIKRFAAGLPEDTRNRGMDANSVTWLISKSGRQELIEILEEFAADANPAVRASIAHAFSSDMNFGEKGRTLVSRLVADQSPLVRAEAASALMSCDHTTDWAVPIVRSLFDDADPRVRASSIEAAQIVLFGNHGEESFGPRLREMLDSPQEDAEVRMLALEILLGMRLIGDDDLLALTKDPTKRVAERAKKFIRILKSLRERARKRQSAGK